MRKTHMARSDFTWKLETKRQSDKVTSTFGVKSSGETMNRIPSFPPSMVCLFFLLMVIDIYSWD